MTNDWKLILKKHHRPIIAGAVLLIGGMVALHLRKPKVILEAVHTEMLPEKTISVQADAQVRPKREEYLVLRKGGSLDKINVSVGQQVQEGTIIALTDAGRHEARLRRALSQYRLAAADYSRTQKLFATATETRQSLDTATNALNVARSEVEEAKKDLEDSLVKAPFAGIVSFISFKIGDYVPDGGRVAVVEDRSGFVLRARLPKHFRKFFPYKGPVQLHDDVNDKAFDIAQVSVKPVQEQEGFFAEDFDVDAELASLPEGLQSRQKVSMRLPVLELKDTMQVPVAAIDQSKEKPRVLVLDASNRLEWREVEILSTERSQAFIVKPKDDWRVVQAVDAAFNDSLIGQKVRPVVKAATVSKR